MLLSARPLKDVQSVNSFHYANQFEFTEGDSLTIYFQLVDAAMDRGEDGYKPPGRRFIPAAGATLSVTIDSIDSAKKVTRVATQPYSQDQSIWAVTIFSTDPLRGTMPLKITLNEGGKITNAMVQSALRIYPKA